MEPKLTVFDNVDTHNSTEMAAIARAALDGVGALAKALDTQIGALRESDRIAQKIYAAANQIGAGLASLGIQNQESLVLGLQSGSIADWKSCRTTVESMTFPRLSDGSPHPAEAKRIAVLAQLDAMTESELIDYTDKLFKKVKGIVDKIHITASENTRNQAKLLLNQIGKHIVRQGVERRQEIINSYRQILQDGLESIKLQEAAEQQMVLLEQSNHAVLQEINNIDNAIAVATNNLTDAVFRRSIADARKSVDQVVTYSIAISARIAQIFGTIKNTSLQFADSEDFPTAKYEGLLAQSSAKIDSVSSKIGSVREILTQRQSMSEAFTQSDDFSGLINEISTYHELLTMQLQFAKSNDSELFGEIKPDSSWMIKTIGELKNALPLAGEHWYLVSPNLRVLFAGVRLHEASFLPVGLDLAIKRLIREPQSDGMRRRETVIRAATNVGTVDQMIVRLSAERVNQILIPLESHDVVRLISLGDISSAIHRLAENIPSKDGPWFEKDKLVQYLADQKGIPPDPLGNKAAELLIAHWLEHMPTEMPVPGDVPNQQGMWKRVVQWFQQNPRSSAVEPVAASVFKPAVPAEKLAEYKAAITPEGNASEPQTIGEFNLLDRRNKGQPITIGRSTDADVSFAGNRRVSKKQATINFTQSGIEIQRLPESNGEMQTKDGKVLNKGDSILLQHGDTIIDIADVRVVFRIKGNNLQVLKLPKIS